MAQDGLRHRNGEEFTSLVKAICRSSMIYVSSTKASQNQVNEGSETPSPIADASSTFRSQAAASASTSRMTRPVHSHDPNGLCD